LWLFRRDYRFPHALVLLPAGILTLFLVNAVRITALILIGSAGAPQIALGGFHSQAGWIAFSAVALGFSVVASRTPWLTNLEQSDSAIQAGIWDNPTATYLLPFLSVLAVGMISTAASGKFEWLYPIRFLTAGVVLLILRKNYSAVDWRFGWFGPSIGVLVFAVWIAIDRFSGPTGDDRMPAALAASSVSIRAIWIVVRSLSAVVTVPIAEELAFRGFLLRRLISSDFEALPPHTFTSLGLVVSSIAFGVLHGNLWLAGFLAGLSYAWALIRRGRLGEAVAAHATTNALIVGYILIFQKWHLWS